MIMTAAESNGHNSNGSITYEHGVPVIDLTQEDESLLIQQIAHACSTFGFFQVVNHDISLELLQAFRHQEEAYFDLPKETKLKYKRNECNARGFFDDELTKQKRDWKEALDVGVPGSRDWDVTDDDGSNACLDGFNQFPNEELPDFLATIVEYFEACSRLSDRLAILMAKGLGVKDENHELLESLRNNHTSYLRMNYYPPCPSDNNTTDESPLGISPHKDAGFLTVLAQDEDCHSLQVLIDDKWTTVNPVRNSLTINTGDMAMIWSNGLYKAPLHRVLTNPTSKRYSAPFFYNPGYNTLIEPLSSKPIYHPCLWGYFRAVRFAGDLTDLGIEIQADDYLLSREQESHHLQKQTVFQKDSSIFQQPFSVTKYRPLLLVQQEDGSAKKEQES